jgi:hypothetical protein
MAVAMAVVLPAPNLAPRTDRPKPILSVTRVTSKRLQMHPCNHWQVCFINKLELSSGRKFRRLHAASPATNQGQLANYLKAQTLSPPLKEGASVHCGLACRRLAFRQSQRRLGLEHFRKSGCIGGLRAKWLIAPFFLLSHAEAPELDRDNLTPSSPARERGCKNLLRILVIWMRSYAPSIIWKLNLYNVFEAVIGVSAATPASLDCKSAFS